MNFSKEEFFAYLLLYAAHADMVESKKEKEHILNKVPLESYARVHEIFDEDSDYQRVGRIIENVKTHNYDQQAPEELLEEIKQTMGSDGELDSAEQSFLVGIRRLIRSAS